MPKFLKIFFILALTLLLLLVIAVGGLFIFIDPNDYKNEIAARVQDATGRTLTISGDIRFSLFPWIGLSLGTTELSNARGFGEQPFAHVDQVDIKVKLIPLLLQQRIEMQKVRLNGLQANLAKDKTGRSNWDDLTAAKTSDMTPPSTKPTPVEESPQPVPRQAPTDILGALAINGLELTNAHLEWDDQQANQHIVIDKLNLQTGPLALPSPVEISLSLDSQLNQPEITAHVDLTSQLVIDPQAQRFQANKMVLKVTARGQGLPLSPMEARIQANVSADMPRQHIDVDKLQLDTLATSLTGLLKVTHLDKAPEVNGQISIAKLTPRDVAKQLGITLPDTADKTVLKNSHADIEFTANSNEARISKLAIAVDDTEIKGTASVKNFAAPAIRFDLNVNGIDIDRYLPPPLNKPEKNKPVSAPTKGSDATAAVPLPLEPLRALDLAGNITLGNLKITGARLTDMQLGMQGKGGQLQLHPVQATLYNGHFDGDITLDVRTDTPKIAVTEKLTSVSVGPLLADVLEKELVSGTANITAQLITTGTELAAIKKSLNGKASFSFRDGKVNGVNIGQMIREAYAKIKKKPVPPKTENATDFAEMSGSIMITDGIVRNNDLSAKSPLLRIKGEGKVDLPQEKVNYLVNAAIVESNEGQTGKELEELKSLTIPVKVAGKLTDPKFSLDLGSVLQNRAKELLDKKVQTEKEKVKERIEKNIKKKLEEDLKKKLDIKF